MNIEFTKNLWEGFEYWLETGNDIVIKIKELLKLIKENPFKGIGKPEPLKHGLKVFWLRKITQEHRLVYKVSEKKERIKKAQLSSADSTMMIN